MNKFLIQIAKPGIFHRWIAVNADNEAAARAAVADRYPEYVIVELRDAGAA